MGVGVALASESRKRQAALREGGLFSARLMDQIPQLLKVGRGGVGNQAEMHIP
jgi:hypothetical protein